MSELRIEEVGEALGLPELGNLTQEDLVDFVPACISGLSDGDLVTLHERFVDPVKIRLYGETIFNAGEVAQRMHDVAIANAEQDGVLHDFQTFMANVCADPESIYRTVTMASAVQVFPEAVVVDDNPIALPRPPKLVVNYTPCLSSRSLLEDQVNSIQRGAPFTYTPTTRMHFTNLMLMKAYEDIMPGLARILIDKRLYIGREDGAGNATDEIIRSQAERGAPVDIADLIICSGDQHASREDLRRGITNGITLLSDEGSLVIRALAKPSEDELGTDQMTEWALEVGFQERSKLEYEGHMHANVGDSILSGKPAARAVKTVILGKN